MADLHQKKEIEPIHFIIGPGRSGTTLLMMLLNNHQDLIASPEIKHILFFYEKYKSCIRFNHEIKTEFINYFIELKTASLNPMFQFDEKKIYDIKENLSFADFCVEIHKALHFNKPVKAIIDKNPFYTQHIDKLLDIYPQAKFIFLVRDYRGFIHSHLNSPHTFQKKRNARFYASSWNVYVSNYLKLSEADKRKILLVKMEDFLNSPEKSLQEICSFLQVEFDDKIFDYKINIEEHLNSYRDLKENYPRLFKKMTDLLRPISGENVCNWKNNLSIGEIKKAEVICGKLGEQIGYRTTTPVSSFQKLNVLFWNFPWYISVNAYFVLVGVKSHHYLNIKRRLALKKNTIK